MEEGEERSPGVRMTVEDDRRVSRSASVEESVMRGTISYCLTVTPSQVSAEDTQGLYMAISLDNEDNLCLYTL